MTYRFTFNKPATDKVIQDRSCVMFSSHGGNLLFRTINSHRVEHENSVIVLEQNHRKVVEGIIDDPTVIETMQPNIEFPFYVFSGNLTIDGVEWLILSHHRVSGNPKKHHHWMRLWFPRDSVSSAEPLDDDILAELGEFVRRIRAAKALVVRNSLGRPSKELLEAKRVMTAFKELVAEITPSQTQQNTSLILDAIGLLQNHLKVVNDLTDCDLTSFDEENIAAE